MNFNGLSVVDKKVVHSIRDDIWPVPSYMEFKPWDKYTNLENARKTEWWNQYAKQFTGSSDINANLVVANMLYNNRDVSMGIKEIIAFPDTIAKDLGGNKDKAVGIANWLGGGGLYKNWLGTKPAWVDPVYYLKTCDIVTEQTIHPWSLSALLTELLDANPAAHEYVLHKAFAKACKVSLADDSGYSFYNNPTANATADAAANFANQVVKIPKILMDTTSGVIKITEGAVGVAGFMIDYWIPIAALVAICGGYAVWKNREFIFGLTKDVTRAYAINKATK